MKVSFAEPFPADMASYLLQVYKFLFNRRDHDSNQSIGSALTTAKAVAAFCALRDFKRWMELSPVVGLVKIEHFLVVV